MPRRNACPARCRTPDQVPEESSARHGTALATDRALSRPVSTKLRRHRGPHLSRFQISQALPARTSSLPYKLGAWLAGLSGRSIDGRGHRALPRLALWSGLCRSGIPFRQSTTYNTMTILSWDSTTRSRKITALRDRTLPTTIACPLSPKIGFTFTELAITFGPPHLHLASIPISRPRDSFHPADLCRNVAFRRGFPFPGAGASRGSTVKLNPDITARLGLGSQASRRKLVTPSATPFLPLARPITKITPLSLQFLRFSLSSCLPYAITHVSYQDPGTCRAVSASLSGPKHRLPSPASRLAQATSYPDARAEQPCPCRHCPLCRART